MPFGPQSPTLCPGSFRSRRSLPAQVGAGLWIGVGLGDQGARGKRCGKRQRGWVVQCILISQSSLAGQSVLGHCTRHLLMVLPILVGMRRHRCIGKARLSVFGCFRHVRAGAFMEVVLVMSSLGLRVSSVSLPLQWHVALSSIMPGLRHCELELVGCYFDLAVVSVWLCPGCGMAGWVLVACYFYLAVVSGKASTSGCLLDSAFL